MKRGKKHPAFQHKIRTRETFMIIDTLIEKIIATQNPTCVGLDTQLSYLPEEMRAGVATPEQAEKICRSVANSLLVKSAWFGADPNWGRIIDAAGYARTGIDFGKIDLYYGDVPAIIKGEPQHSNKELWKKVVSAKEFEITLALNLGKCSESILTTDLTTGYVEFNKGE